MITEKELRTLFKSMCGLNRNMSAFANDVKKTYPVTVATLYKIAKLGRKTPLKENLIEALILHRDPECKYTPEQIREMLNQAYRTPSQKRVTTKERRKRAVKRAILDASVNRGLWVQKGDYPESLSDNVSYDELFHSCLNVGETSEVSQHVYISAAESALNHNVEPVIFNRIGHAICMNGTENDYHVIIFITDNDGQALTQQIRQLSATTKNAPVNICAVVVSEAIRIDFKVQKIHLSGKESLLSFGSWQI